MNGANDGKGKRKDKKWHVGKGSNFKPVIRGRDGDRLPYIEDSRTGCWICTGKPNQFGYPMINCQPAGRIYYEAVYGVVIPDGFQVHHFLPDCPRRCCNPAHLVIVTTADHAKLERQLRQLRRLIEESGD